jgi:hypothetical protein
MGRADGSNEMSTNIEVNGVVIVNSRHVDIFTREHLETWARIVVCEDERDEFIGWTIDQIEEDETLLELGWPSLFRSFQGHATGTKRTGHCDYCQEFGQLKTVKRDGEDSNYYCLKCVVNGDAE